MNTKNFFAELKRRKVYQVAVAYAVVETILTAMISNHIEQAGCLIELYH
jgi:hypothetical protein